MFSIQKTHIKIIFIVGIWFIMPTFLLFYSSSLVHAASPVGYWKFDEITTGTNAVDVSGNSNDAVPTGTPSPSTDTPPAIKFTNPRSTSLNGSSYFTIDRPIQNSFSICVWIKTLSVGVGSAHWQTAALFDSELGGLGDDMGFGIDDNGYLTYGNGGTFDDMVHGDILVADNTWHHVCVTREQTSGMVTLYVDGINDATGIIDTATLDGNPQALIGYGTDGAVVITGFLDDYRIYDRVLTADQIAYLAAGNDGTEATEEDLERATIHSWKASVDHDSQDTCSQKLRLVIKGKNFDDDAEVFLGSKKSSSVKVTSDKRLEAKFCLSKLLSIKTHLKRSVGVKNPDTKARQADKKIDLTLFPINTNLDQSTREGITNIQKLLVTNNFLGEEYITGFYGPITQEAIRNFQSKNRIPTTGNVGVLTRAALLK